MIEKEKEKKGHERIKIERRHTGNKEWMNHWMNEQRLKRKKENKKGHELNTDRKGRQWKERRDRIIKVNANKMKNWERKMKKTNVNTKKKRKIKKENEKLREEKRKWNQSKYNEWKEK